MKIFLLFVWLAGLFFSLSALGKEQKKYVHIVADTFIECPNLYDALNSDYKILSHEVKILNNRLEDYFEIFIIQKEEGIYRYMLSGLFYKNQSCVKFYKSDKDFQDTLTHEQRIEMLKTEID